MEKNRNTVMIDKTLYRKLKVYCSILGLKMKDVMIKLIEQWLVENEEKVKIKQKEYL